MMRVRVAMTVTMAMCGDIGNGDSGDDSGRDSDGGSLLPSLNSKLIR